MILVTIPVLAMKDADFDGVSDAVDKCPQTPFLSEVDATGCTVKILTLPSETESKRLQAVLGYGVVTDEDLLGREEQHSSNLKLSYYQNSWAYSFSGGYYQHGENEGSLDTTFKVKKRFTILPKLQLGLGLGLKLPTYDFQGNNTDYAIYGSLNYYPLKSLSLFGHYNHTFIQDEEVSSQLQDSEYLSGGVGYFFTKQLYANIVYAEGNNKFASQHDIKSISSTLYYKMNKKWFSLLYYSEEIDDEDAHNTFNVKLGYKIW